MIAQRTRALAFGLLMLLQLCLQPLATGLPCAPGSGDAHANCCCVGAVETERAPAPERQAGCCASEEQLLDDQPEPVEEPCGCLLTPSDAPLPGVDLPRIGTIDHAAPGFAASDWAPCVRLASSERNGPERAAPAGLGPALWVLHRVLLR